ncbi:hypothetical protein SARC_04007 [Sphaeroforma arctica JP610]|uniref:Uncharacterized protein n=1 Tax=Sphaeroforma arctica JP610 TaxID=667725 RepID=A0A0L0G3S0_9EUKA|nr:hypothetical protein SARC_04007 [Sphaeroforma arctica JP610]KNC83757.1 hypothetical protein SARC_04007 [Sphaeroforma arctica JP610]|eukprot:XP_014157659.1 hypothetical protein SARC_04007 [Sphaeroforma arctica JP610]
MNRNKGSLVDLHPLNYGGMSLFGIPEIIRNHSHARAVLGLTGQQPNCMTSCSIADATCNKTATRANVLSPHCTLSDLPPAATDNVITECGGFRLEDDAAYSNPSEMSPRFSCTVTGDGQGG